MASTTATPTILAKTKLDGTLIEQVDKIPVPEGKIGKINITNQDSGYGEENMPGRFSPGDTAIEGVYAAGLPGIQFLKSKAADYKKHNLEVSFINGESIKANCYLGPFLVKDDKDRLVYSVDVMVLGIPDVAADLASLTTPYFTVKDQADSAITDITGSAGAGAAATPGFYIVRAANTVTSLKISPTDTATDAVLYVNDTAVSSGGTATVALGAAGTNTTITIRVTEPSKGDAYYFLYVTKAASA